MQLNCNPQLYNMNLHPPEGWHVHAHRQKVWCVRLAIQPYRTGNEPVQSEGKRRKARVLLLEIGTMRGDDTT